MKQRGLGCLLEVAETLVLTLLIFLAIQYFVAQPYEIEQQSMERTLEPNQYVLVDKLSPHFSDYKRGDIVVFNPPAGWESEGSNTPFIKRVIGLGGDTVQLRNGKVLVNGVQLDEPYVYAGQSTGPLGSGGSTWTIPEGDLFVMGDHRENSMDSRAFGPIPKSTVIGRAWLRYWPIGTLGIIPSADYSSHDPGSPASPSPSAGGSRSPTPKPSASIASGASGTPRAAASASPSKR